MDEVVLLQLSLNPWQCATEKLAPSNQSLSLCNGILSLFHAFHFFHPIGLLHPHPNPPSSWKDAALPLNTLHYRYTRCAEKLQTRVPPSLLQQRVDS